MKTYYVLNITKLLVYNCEQLSWNVL